MIPPILFVAGLKLIEKMCKGSPSSRGGSSSAPPDCSFYSVPKHGLDDFARDHPDFVYYTTFAKQLADAGFHEYSCNVTKQGDALMRKYRCERYIVCADFRPMG